jgi:hypothetical protein
MADSDDTVALDLGQLTNAQLLDVAVSAIEHMAWAPDVADRGRLMFALVREEVLPVLRGINEVIGAPMEPTLKGRAKEDLARMIGKLELALLGQYVAPSGR